MKSISIKLKNKCKIRGPIDDLEKHLPYEWWRNLFNASYIKTDGDVCENDNNTKQDIDLLIKATNIKHRSSILDLCCGQGRHSLELYKRGFNNVVGIDNSAYLINLARRRAKNLDIPAKFLKRDVRNINFQPLSYDCVAILGNSFGYFANEEDDVNLLASISRLLKINAHLVLDIVNGQWMANNFEPRSWEWIDSRNFVCRERSFSRDKSLIIARELLVHISKGVILDQVYATRLYTAEKIKSILCDLHYKNIKINTNFFTKSDRGQDLGMMTRRMFISAQKRSQ